VTAAAIVERLVLWLGVRGRTQGTEWTRTLGLPVSVVATDETAPEPRELPMDAPVPRWQRWWPVLAALLILIAAWVVVVVAR
jgi:hypothetical protein